VQPEQAKSLICDMVVVVVVVVVAAAAADDDYNEEEINIHCHSSWGLTTQV